MVKKRRYARYEAEQLRRAGQAAATIEAETAHSEEPGPEREPAAAVEPMMVTPPTRPASAAAVEPSAPEPVAAVEPEASAATTAPPLVEPAGDTLTFASSNIRGAELDAATGVLEVEFTNGKRYRYASFTRELLAQWGKAESAGKWFNVNVKGRADRHPPIAASPVVPPR